MVENITFRWIPGFADRFRVINRSQSGKLEFSQLNQMEIKIGVAKHLENLMKLFGSENL